MNIIDELMWLSRESDKTMGKALEVLNNLHYELMRLEPLLLEGKTDLACAKIKEMREMLEGAKMFDRYKYFRDHQRVSRYDWDEMVRYKAYPTNNVSLSFCERSKEFLAKYTVKMIPPSWYFRYNLLNRRHYDHL